MERTYPDAMAMILFRKHFLVMQNKVFQNGFKILFKGIYHS